MLLIPDTDIISTYFSKDTPNLYEKERGKRHAFEIVLSLAILGPSITSEMEKFVSNSNYYQNNPLQKNTLRNKYNVIINGRYEKKSGGKKIGKRYPGLIENNYVIQTGDKIVVTTKTSMYFLSIKGCLFALGFELNNQQLSSLIDNAARNHLFFCFLKQLLEKTSLNFVKDLSLIPIKDLIKRKE